MQTAWFFSDWDPEHWIAAYAALVSTFTAFGGVVVWLDRQRTKVTVAVIDSLEPRLSAPRRRLDYVVMVQVTNSGHATQYVEKIGLRTIRGSEVLVARDYGSEDLVPNETISYRVVLEKDLREIGQLVAFVLLGNRKEVTSRPHQIRSDVVKEWTAHEVLTWD